MLPTLAAHFDSHGVDAPTYCSQWFLTMFAYTLPFEHLVRVWDIFLHAGTLVCTAVGGVVMRMVGMEMVQDENGVG